MATGQEAAADAIDRRGIAKQYLGDIVFQASQCVMHAAANPSEVKGPRPPREASIGSRNPSPAGRIPGYIGTGLGEKSGTLWAALGSRWQAPTAMGLVVAE